MTIQEFKLIPTRAEKFSTLLCNGTLVDERYIYGKFEIQLYSLHDFFVEVWTDLQSHELDKILPLDSEESWFGFLQSVSLHREIGTIV